MKTLKFALIAMFLATALVNQAASDGFKTKPKKAINMTFDRAIKNPELVTVMHAQIDPEFLNTIEQLYVVEVDYRGIVYRILGSRQSWIQFLRPKPIRQAKFKIVSGSTID